MSRVEDCVELGGAGVQGEGGVSGVDVSGSVIFLLREAILVPYCALSLHDNAPISPHTKSNITGECLKSHLLQLLVQITRPLMETHHTRHTHRAALQVRHTSRDPVRTHAHSRKTVNSSFCAQVVDLLWRGIQFEESVVNGAGNGLGKRIFGPLAALDGGDG
jgi:hypothetical protein